MHPDAIRCLKPLKLSDDAGLKVIEFLATPISGLLGVVPLDSLHAQRVLIKMNRFLFHNKNIIDKNGYDFHLILTSQRLHTGRAPNLHKWIGYTYYGSVCPEHDKRSRLMPLGAIVDERQDTYQTIGAHEIAHMLEIDHDVSLTCRDGYIMSKYIITYSNSYDWSECSKTELQKTFESEKFSCLRKWPQFSIN
ncbi:uncharacterized protein LOC130665218 isoform X2 [Microplitis mediator]|uniref:uncharacterized protein LOC130665218 isoform X2 n=1 Tax=Microplitis mediator TaxID=375433 RepID=UPI002553B00C|nr:uncharacterized protein LOC130665218 isoform X2 [Microplitis mediator]